MLLLTAYAMEREEILKSPKLLMKNKSSSTYDAIRKAGFIYLPNERTLQDYTNSFTFTSGTGFHSDIIRHRGHKVDLTIKHEDCGNSA